MTDLARPFVTAILLSFLCAALPLPVAAAANPLDAVSSMPSECSPDEGTIYQLQDGTWCLCPDPLKLLEGMPVMTWWAACWQIPPIVEVNSGGA